MAQEVRELAQRSAKAAKEIKELISISSTQVDSGVQPVEETGSSQGKIVEQVLGMSQTVHQIPANAREQAVSLRGCRLPQTRWTKSHNRTQPWWKKQRLPLRAFYRKPKIWRWKFAASKSQATIGEPTMDMCSIRPPANKNSRRVLLGLRSPKSCPASTIRWDTIKPRQYLSRQ